MNILRHPGSTQKFIDHFESEPKTKAATGDQTPQDIDSILYKILNIEALYPEISTPERKYLIGRCMAIRKKDYFVPKTVFDEDMFLSNHLVNKYGFEAVKKISGVLVSYTGPQTLNDYYFKTRRYTLDKEAMYDAYPEFIKLKPWFKRTVNPELKKTLSNKEQFYLLTHDIVKYLSVKLAHLSGRERWVTLETTKGVLNE